MFKSNRNTWNKLNKNNLEKRKWYVFRWEFALIFGLALFAAILNQIPNWYVKPLADGSIDPILSYPLINNITYTTVSIVVTVGISIFIGVYTEVGKFAGKYGSAIFVLVPSFVWLLSDRGDARVDAIVDTAVFLGTFLFWFIVGIVSLFAILITTKIILRHTMTSKSQKLMVEFVVNYINRFLVILINISIVLMLGYSLVNYGILSLHLADITPEMHQANPGLSGKTHDMHSEAFTTYIALVAVFFALLMVFIGLTNIFTRKASTNLNIDEIESESVETAEDKEIEVADDDYKDTLERGPDA